MRTRTHHVLFVVAAFCILVFPAGALAALVNINTADEAALDTLPGIGPTKAAAIVAYRGTHGPFATTEDIQAVSGIGPATFAKLEALITVGTVNPVQPTAPPTRSQEVRAVVPAVSSSPNVSTHQDQTVSAPAATSSAAAAGALQPAGAVMSTPAPPGTGAGLLHSRWAIGVLAVIAFAGAAFMIL